MRSASESKCGSAPRALVVIDPGHGGIDNGTRAPSGEPEKTIVLGTVTALRPNHSQRVQARLNADFTPFHIPIVHFSEILLPDGTTVPIKTADAQTAPRFFT